MDYNIYCTITFGESSQSNNDSNLTNSIILRKIDGIYLQSLGRIQDRREIYIHSVITGRKIIDIKILKEIVNQIEEMTAREKVTSFKFKNRAGVINDNDWIKGV